MMRCTVMAAAAMAEPEMAPNSIEAMMLTNASPPGSQPTSDRANASTAPDTSPGIASGRVTRRKTVVGPAPSEAATTS